MLNEVDQTAAVPLGYDVANLGLNNQKVALFGLFAKALHAKRNLVLPAFCNFDTASARHTKVALDRAFSKEHLFRFGQAYGIDVSENRPFEDADGWGCFCFGTGHLAGDLTHGAAALDSFTGQFFRSLVPVLTGEMIFQRLAHEVFETRRVTTVCQLRIEKDWVAQAEAIKSKPFEFADDPAPSYREIFAKMLHTIPAAALGQTIYVVCDENSLPVPKETIRAAVKAEFGLAIIWKSDILTDGEMTRLSILDQSIVDFEIAVRAPVFVGLSRSTFPNGVTIESFCRQGALSPSHYIYNQIGPRLGQRHDYGIHVDPAQVTRSQYRRRPLIAATPLDCSWPVTLCVHFSGTGDFTTKGGEVAGGRQVPIVAGTTGQDARTIEGFQVNIGHHGTGGGIEYRARMADGTWTPLHRDGAYAGTKGLSRVITGFAAKLTGRLALSYECIGVGAFAGHEKPVQAGWGEACVPPDLSPLLAMQLVFRPLRSQVPGPPASAPEPRW